MGSGVSYRGRGLARGEVQKMRYLSVCSGIEAATVAWEPLGWEAVAYAEIEKFPAALLAHHYPNVPNLGDFTKVDWRIYREAVDLVVAGTPCQDFSVAGLRAGLAGARGNLTLKFLRVLDEARPRWVVWENVPGVLSVDGGRAFGAFLGGLAQLGYGFAYRILDAQYFGVAQRRRRVFVVGYLGDWRAAAAVLFEREGMRRDSAPSREAGQGVAADVASCLRRGSTNPASHGKLNGSDRVDLVACFGGGNPGVLDVATTRSASGSASGRMDFESETFAVSVALRGREGGGTAELGDDKAHALRASGGGGDKPHVLSAMQVRRLTPRECERLQGFPDDYTQIPWRNKPAEECPDGPRYKALGNSMAVPCMAWIGKRIAWEDILG